MSKQKTLADYAEQMYLLLCQFEDAVQEESKEDQSVGFDISELLDMADHDRELLFCDIKANVDLKKYERSED